MRRFSSPPTTPRSRSLAGAGMTLMVRAVLAQRHAVAALVVAEPGGVVPHEQQAAAGRPVEVLDGTRVGDLVRVEALPLVLDLYQGPAEVDPVAHVDLQRRLMLVAVLDGVDAALFP